MDHSKDGKENIFIIRGALSNVTVAVVTPNEQEKTVGKALVDRWFYTCGIPSRICSDQGKSFDNKIINHPHMMYGIQQSRTTSYNQQGNPKCKRFIQTLHNLLKMLPKSQKPNWPAHLNSLVFTNNAMPDSATGLQPYQLMFGHKAQIPCNNWLGLKNYGSSESVSKSSC